MGDRPVAEEIVGEASRLFARRGVNATTMAQIAEAAGLQVSSIYYYFRSKHEILERIVGDVNRLPLEALARSVAAHDTPAAQLHAFIRADAATLCEFPFDINEIHRLAGEDDSTFALYWSERQELVRSVEAVIAAGVAAGQLIDVDTRLCALTILANDEAAQNWYRPTGARRRVGQPGMDDVDPSGIGSFLADLALRGLLVDPAELAAVRAATDPGDP